MENIVRPIHHQAPAVAPVPRTESFEAVLRGVKNSPILQPLAESWRASELALHAVPRDVRGLFQLQRSVSNCQLQVECFGRVADSVGASIRRLQQLSGQ